MLQHLREVWIVWAVEADEADIYRHLHAGVVDIDSPGMSPETRRLVVYNDVGILAQRPCCAKAGNAPANDRNTSATRGHAEVS